MAPKLSKHMPPGDRLLAKRRIVPSTGCWLWTGGKLSDGYGHLCVHNRRVLAHRLSWEVWVGPIPADLCVLHRCDTPACFNPEHLWLGTRSENNRDMLAKGRFVHWRLKPRSPASSRP